MQHDMTKQVAGTGLALLQGPDAVTRAALEYFHPSKEEGLPCRAVPVTRERAMRLRGRHSKLQ